MSDVVFDGISKRFGSTLALDALHLTVHAGELLCLLGPSGCGKTTALRILAGFEVPDTGDVRVGGRSVLGVDARHRGFGMVFQSYSLFPNMTAARNIGFALQMKGVKGARQKQRVDELLAMTGLSVHADKYPHQLSGGQQQRVALARALATEPPVLLLDEPLSALDAAVRDQLRGEIRRLQRELGITTLFVTHDQHEAMAIADRIGVMNAGALAQVSPPAEVYSNPVDSFVSTFLGTSNLLPVVPGAHGEATVLGRPLDNGHRDAARVHVRPEHIRIVRLGDDEGDDEGDAHHGHPAVVTALSFRGPLTRADCVIGDLKVAVDLPSREASGLVEGDEVRLVLDGPVTPSTV
ncbi:MAG: ABC transporter ATP-binding protein [Acidimicrobiales bacterium]|nr:ABC transporter ATP-binding protein [Acidimicrobiales bacterium]